MSLKQFFSDVDNRISLASLIEKEVKLTKRGREYVGLCPFHNEKSPSFSVIEDKKFFYCFGCGKSGRAIDWLTERRGLTFKEGLDFLSQLSGVPLPTLKKTGPIDNVKRDRESEVYPLIMASVKDYYQQCLRGAMGKHAHDYLKGRGLTEQTIQHFGIGFSPDEFDPRNLLQEVQATLPQHRITEQDLVNLGLIRIMNNDRTATTAQAGQVANQPSTKRRTFLLFRGRVMFPIQNRAGAIIGFGGRFLGDAAKNNTGKYINSPDSAVFFKGSNLYNFKNALQAVKNKQPLLVVEGYMDVIGLAQAGFLSAVAPLGTALTQEQLTLLWQMNEKPIIAFDGDNAGTMAAFRAARRALPHLASHKTLEFVFMPQGDDPDSLVRRSGIDGLQAVLNKKTPLHEFLWWWELSRADLSRPEGQLAFEQSLINHARAITDPALAKLYQETFREKIFQQKRQRQTQTKNNKSPYKRGVSGARPRGAGLLRTDDSQNPRNNFQKSYPPRGYGNRADQGAGLESGLPSLPKIIDDLSQHQPHALLATITLYPKLYQEWREAGLERAFHQSLADAGQGAGSSGKNPVKPINKHLDNYLKKLHILTKGLSDLDRPDYQNPNPESALNQWQQLLEKLFAEDHSDSLWHKIFDKNLKILYPQIFRGHEGDARDLMNELTQLEVIDKLQQDFHQQKMEQSLSPASNIPVTDKKKIDSFLDEIQRAEHSLHQRALKTES